MFWPSLLLSMRAWNCALRPFHKMSEQKERRRSWGRTKHREVTVIDQKKIEETLHSFAEEVRKREVVSNEISVESTGGIDLQYPELMSNDALISALKRIKVPIPVYPDGSPSRERLLYLFKTNVLPRPQRKQWKQKRRLQGSIVSHDDHGGSAMEVDDWCAGGAQTAELQRKRYTMKQLF